MEDENLKQFLKTTILLSSKLDDAGLSSAEFRVYAHISRRAGRGVAFPKIESIASTCRLNCDTVRKSLKTLNDRGMISRKERPGMTTEITLTEPGKWLHPSGNEGAPSFAPLGNEGRAPLGNEGRLRRPIEGDPLKETHLRNKAREMRASEKLEPTPVDAFDGIFSEILCDDQKNRENLDQWHAWIEYRNEHRHGKGRGKVIPVTAISAKQSLRILSRAKSPRTISATIAAAIAGEWDGIHIPFGSEESFYK